MIDKTKKKKPSKPRAKFSTKFILFGDTFAKDLEKALNWYAKGEWTILRTDPLPTGYLVIALKTPPEPPAVSLGDLLRGAHMVEMGQPPAVLSSDAKSFLTTFFEANPARGQKDATIEKASETLTPILKKYTNDRLRPIIENLKIYVEGHKKDHAGSPCELAEIIEKVLEVSEKYVQQNVS